MRARCDHVAVLVRDLAAARRRLAWTGLPAGRVERHPGEGTVELYLGGVGAPGRLLLVQPIGGGGPYARALAERGPGLHHVALEVPDAAAWAADHDDWRVHPHSARTLPRTAWLHAPGVGVLLEVTSATAGAAPPTGAPATVSRLEVPDTSADLVRRLDVDGTTLAAAGRAAAVVIGGDRVDVAWLGA